MKKTLIALAAVAAATGAMAQNVTLYGVVDVGFINDGVNGTKFAGAGVNGTPRLGVKGDEDLGGGLKAVFQIETGLNSGKETATSLGDRGAFAGIAGGFGTVTLGSSVLSPSFYARGATDASTTNNYGIAKFAGATRLDNSINYTSPNWNGLTLRASAVLSADNGGNSATDLSAVYANGPLTVAASFADNGTDKGNFIGASYDFGMAKVLVNQTDVAGATAGAKDKYTAIGVSAPIGAVTLQADYRKNKTADNSTYVLSAQYALSKRSSLTAYTQKTSNADAAYGFGIRHNF